jgi:glyoxylase-like metal-dependent hydrolase (beta-lactamase superfamily II)
MRSSALAFAVVIACGAPARKSTPPPSNKPAAVTIPTPRVPADPSSWRMERLADGVYAWLGPPGVTPIVSGNSVVVIGDDGVLVVDTGQFPSIARAEIAEIRKLTDEPVRFVVTTHWHPDHWMGNGELAAAYPGAAFIATPNTRALATSKALPFVSEKYARDTAAQVRPMIAAGKSPSGKALTAIQRAYYTIGVAQLDEYGDELATARPLPPSTTFEDALTIHLGAREVDVRFLGRGNTGGDAVVWIPDAKVLATGDLIVSPYPYGIGSFIGEWIDTLGRVEAFGATTIVPGHGPLMHDLAYVHTLEEILRSVRDQTKAAAAKGLSLEDTRAAVNLDAFADRLCGDDPWCRFGFAGVFVQPAVARGYREAKEGPLHDED